MAYHIEGYERTRRARSAGAHAGGADHLCGFVGFTAVDYDTDTNKAVVKDKADRNAQRGPDDEGFYEDDDIAMGFRR